MKFLRYLRLLSCAALLASAPGTMHAADAAPLEVDVFKGGFATVNSFILSNGKSLIVMDVQRKTYEAKKLPLTHILISHGHTDHFTGMDYFHREFPDARIVVATEDIKRDVREYAVYMDSGGETGAEPALEPALRPKSAENLAGFDYENTIQVLAGNTLVLEGGGTLEITTDYEPTEAQHIDGYTRVVTQASSREEAMQGIMALYPDYKEADFFLKHSVENHVKPHR